jgi:hypothetical protein
VGAIEAYLILLVRLGRHADALEEFARLVPRDTALSVYAPTPLDLARASGGWQRYLEIVRDRGDTVAYAAGLVEMA